MKISRRELIKSGLAAGTLTVTGAWPDWLHAGQQPAMTTIPSTGEKVPSVGIGTVDFRGDVNSAKMEPLRETLRIFHKLGGRVVDTSPNYGNSEEVLGHLLRELGIRDQVFMATKVDREDQQDGIERMNSSAGRLGDAIDLMQVHNLRGTDLQLQTMQAWKAEGRLKYIGITTHRVSQHDEIERYMNAYPLDFVQVNYSLADRAAADRLLPLAQDKGVAVLVNRPFGDGRLFGSVKGVEVPGWGAEIGAATWGQVLLKYIISHPAATIPIPGTTKPHHAEDNVSALFGEQPDAAMRRTMETYFDKLL